MHSLQGFVRAIALGIGLVLAGTGFALAGPPAPSTNQASTAKPKLTPQTQRLLKAMAHANTWGHPDLFGQYSGMRHYFHGDYAGAMKYFKYGARYADKLSQLLIGLMYARGNGVAANPQRACAWLQLAASHRYTRFVQVRNAICGVLNPHQQQQAKQILAKLEPTYGDKATTSRLKVQMLMALHERTGSHIGFDAHDQSMNPGMGQRGHRASDCDGPSITYAGHVVPHDGCGGMWASWYRQPDQYLSVRESQWRGSVTVGALQPTNAPAAASSSHTPAVKTIKAHAAPAVTNH